MKRFIMPLVTVAILTSCSSENPEHVASHKLKELLGSGQAWCQNYENGTCSAVSRFKSISADSVQRTHYFLTRNSLKIVMPVTFRLTSSGDVCFSPQEATLRATLIYRTFDNLADVTDGDTLIRDGERERLLNLMKDGLNQDFGKEECSRFKIAEARDGKIERIEEFTFIDGIKQPKVKRSLYKFYTQDSNGIRLRVSDDNT